MAATVESGMSELPPDVSALMREIEDAARRIEAEQPPAVRRPRRVPAAEPVHALEHGWDVWNLDEVRTHRGWKGVPIVVAKRTLLKVLGPYGRELLRRQREFNRASKDEIQTLRQSVVELRAELLELRARLHQRGHE